MDDLFVARLLINHLRLGYFGVCNTWRFSHGSDRIQLPPPCWPADQACPNQRDLVSPEGIRMSPMRLQGLAWRQDAEMRLAHVRARNATAKVGHRGMVTVIRMPVRDWHAERFGSRAG